MTARIAPAFRALDSAFDAPLADSFLLLTDRCLRVACGSCAAGSSAGCRRQGRCGYWMTKAALNMAVRVMPGRLRREGAGMVRSRGIEA
jgi:hypothetical protein